MGIYGTYSESKIVTARVSHSCERCQTSIPQGAAYLRYAYGLRNRRPVCLSCADLLGKYGGLIYDCAANRDRLGMEQRRI